MFVTNLKIRKIRGLESQAMILALSTDENQFSLIKPDSKIPNGALVK
jgi:tRNA-binding EMAP/Myf-like protein